jgi:hypothetical protein
VLYPVAGESVLSFDIGETRVGNGKVAASESVLSFDIAW